MKTRKVILDKDSSYQYSPEIKSILDSIQKNEIPNKFPDSFYSSENNIPSSFIDNFAREVIAHKKGMYVLVDLFWTEKLANWINGRKVLEVMSGTGWLAKALRHHHVDIIATDNDSWSSRWNREKITDVISLDAIDAISSYSDSEILLLSWPPMEEEILPIAKAWGTERPIIYIGEFGGCTGGEDFFEFFDESELFKIPTWFGIYDRLTVGIYNPKGGN